jgi:hypothetical protein
MPGLVPGIPTETHCAKSVGITGTSPVMITESDTQNLVAGASRDNAHSGVRRRRYVSVHDQFLNTSLGFVARSAARVIKAFTASLKAH